MPCASLMNLQRILKGLYNDFTNSTGIYKVVSIQRVGIQCQYPFQRSMTTYGRACISSFKQFYIELVDLQQITKITRKAEQPEEPQATAEGGKGKGKVEVEEVGHESSSGEDMEE